MAGGQRRVDSAEGPTWQLAPATGAVTPAEVHVWRASLQQPTPVRLQLWETLTTDERSRALRYRQEPLQHAWIVGRGVVRSLLSRYLECLPAAIQFAYTDRGKPILAQPPHPALAFNVTHSHQMLLCAIAWHCEIGIDVEHQRAIAQLTDIVERYFSPAEQATILAAPSQHRSAEFFRLWTLKEAICKATGQGIQGLAETTLTCHTQPMQVQTVYGQPPSQTWSLHSFSPEPNYVGAIAYTAPPRSLRYWQWHPTEATPSGSASGPVP